jgi:hypothetical protein
MSRPDFDIMRHGLIAAFFSGALLLGFIIPAFAQDSPQEPKDGEIEPYADPFNGSFVEFSVRGAPTSAPGSAWAVDTGLRQAFPFLLGDTRLAYRYDRTTPDGFDRLETHELGVQLGLHPLYLLLLGSDWFSYVVSSLYLELGLGGHLGVATRPEETETDLGFVWSVGAGIDIPLSDPDVGWAPWVNVLYRYRGADFDASGGEVELGAHAIFIGLGIRRNGLLF